MKVEHILQEIERLSGDVKQIVVGFSGGLDSSVLLHILSQSKFMDRLVALHINHGLSAHSDAWARHCHEQCKLLGVPLTVESVVVKKDGGGLEEAARDARYAAFERYVHTTQNATKNVHRQQPHDRICILTGHHANDQAETMLFRLFRGTGIKGLSGIQSIRKISGGARVVRPLLSFSRSQLADYAKVHSLCYVDDESNLNQGFDRNYLRSTVLPLVQKRWPQALDQLGSLAKRAVEYSNLLHEYALEDLTVCEARAERVGFSLDIDTFSTFSRVRQYHLLREWASNCGFDAPMPAHLDQLVGLLSAADDANPAIEWGGAALARYNNRLFLLPRSVLKNDTRVSADSIHWDPIDLCRLPDGSRLELFLDSSVVRFESERISVRFRQGGERCKPLGRNHSQTLKKLLQEYALEPWLRYRVPLIYKNDELIAVGDLWWCSDFGSTSIKWSYEQKKK